MCYRYIYTQVALMILAKIRLHNVNETEEIQLSRVHVKSKSLFYGLAEYKIVLIFSLYYF
jgi:hypothetical protein